MGVRHPQDLDATPVADVKVRSESFLETSKSESNLTRAFKTSSLHKTRFFYFGSFLLGILVHSLFLRCLPMPGTSLRNSLVSRSMEDTEHASPYAGSQEVDPYPHTQPTNADPSLFPSNVGFAGPTPTGAEPAVLATAPAYPVHSGAPGLIVPPALDSKPGQSFEMLRKWGNLSPWYSNEKGTFGVDSDPEVPEGCSVTGLHLLHRHGARYPTSGNVGPSGFATKLYNATGNWAPFSMSPISFALAIIVSASVLPEGQQRQFDLLLAGIEGIITFSLAYPASVALGSVLLQTSPPRGSTSGRMEAFLRAMKEIERHPQVLHLPPPHIWQLTPSVPSKQSLVVSLELHVRKDMDDEDVLKLTKWAWERCVGSMGFGRGAGKLPDGGGAPEVTVGIVKG